MQRLFATTIQIALTVTVLAGCQPEPTAPEPVASAPDVIVINADVYTVDDNNSRAEAFAIRDGRFAAIGSTREISSLADSDTRVIDAMGRSVVPGFIDSHAHVSGTAPRVAGVDLSYIVDKADWLKLIAEADARLPDGQWLRGGYWDHTLSDSRYPTKEMLDSIVPDRPIFLSHIDGHYGWVNSLALEMAGVTAESPVPPGGQIVIDENSGELTGILLEGAQSLVRDVIPEMAESRRREGLATMQAYANSLGITTLHQMGSLDDYLHIVETGAPSVRVWYGPWLSGGLEDVDGRSVQDVLDMQANVASRVEMTGKSDMIGPLLELGFVKLMNDGVLSAHTAVLTEDYADRAGWTGEYITSPQELADQVQKLNSAGLPVAIHSIGDAAVQASLDAFEAAQGPALAVPNRVEHVELLHTEDIERFRSLGVVASMQPNHATNSIAYVPIRVGPTREAKAYTWQSLTEAGVPLVFGSDYPTSPLSPLTQIADAIFRVSPFGLNDGEPWYPEQAVDFDVALEAYTRTGANITSWSEEIGSISANKWADFVILSGPVPEPINESFRDLKVHSTYFSGREVFLSAE